MKHNPLFRSFLLGSSLLAAPSLHAADGTYTSQTGDWNVAGSWDGDIIADGSGFTASFTNDVLADSTTLLGEDRTIGNITFTDADNTAGNGFDRTISGNILTLAGSTPTISVTQSDRNLTLSSVIAGSTGLRKTGLGSFTLNGSAANTFTGGVNVNRGTLKLDYANLGATNNLVDSTNAFTLGGGSKFSMTGNADDNSVQTFADTTFGAGKNTVSLFKGASAASATLELGALTMNAGSITDIVTGTLLPSSPSTTEILKITSYNGNALPTGSNKAYVNAGLFYRVGVASGQNDPSGAAGRALWASVDSNGQLMGVIANTVNINTNPNGSTVVAQGSTNHVLSSSGSNIYGLLANRGSVGTLTLTLGSGNNLTVNGIIQVQIGTYNIVPGTGGSVVIGAEKNLVINMDNTGPLGISAPIVDNGGGASSVTIGSTLPTGTPGTVTLSGNSAYTGHTYINAVNVTLGHNNALGTTDSGTTLIGSALGSSAGTSLDLGSTARVLSEAFNINGNELGRARIFNNAAVAHALNGNMDVTSDTGFAQIWNNNNSGSITVNGDITGTLTNNSALVLRGTSTNANNAILGSINLTGPLGKADAGTWMIGAVGETYSWGDTYVTRGTLTMGEANVLPATSVVFMGQDDANPATLDLNGFGQTVAGIQLAPIPGSGTRTITSSASATLTVGDANDHSYEGILTGSLALTKTGIGTLTLAGANTYTGDTLVNEGTLVLADNAQLKFLLGATSGDNNSLTGAGTVTLDGDFSIDTSAADALSSGSWTIVANSTLAETYSDSFSVIGFDDIGSNKWEKALSPTKKYTFDESTGILTLETTANTFASWISNAEYGLAEVDQDLGDDPDGDGIDNGVENFFGTNPGVSSSGLVAVSAGGGVFTFIHPQNATPASDLTASYTWSKDLANFLAGGATDGALTKVDFTTQAGIPAPGFTTVTATVTGTLTSELFVRANVTQP